MESVELSPASTPDTGTGSPETDNVGSFEDSGTQALSEALRSSFVIVRIVIILLIALFFASGIFTVGPQEIAIKLRFGKPIGTGDGRLLQPGLHWRLPSPIDEIVKIPKGQVQTVVSSVGWYNVTREQELAGTEPAMGASLNPAADGYALTADGNIIHVRATLRYYISDPVAFSFNFANATNLIQSAIDNAINYAAARFTVDQATRTEITAFKEKIMARVTQLTDLQLLGINFDSRNADIVAAPPRQVRAAFNQVLESEQERSRTINRAQATANETKNKAEGEAESVRNGARAEATRIVQSAQGDAEYLLARLPEYQRNPKLFRERRITETMALVFPRLQNKFFLMDRGGDTTRQLRLMLNQEPDQFRVRPRTTTPDDPDPEDGPPDE